MVEKHLKEMNETKKQIRSTQSSRRKYELMRHLRKLQKEYNLYCALRKWCRYGN